MMKILHFYEQLRGGGIGAMIAGLANAQRRKAQVEVCLIYEVDDRDIFAKKLDPEVSFNSLHKEEGRITIKDLIDIFWHIKRGGYDVVNLHAHFYRFMLPIILLHRSVKFFYTVHSEASKENCRFDNYLLPLKKFCFKRKWLIPVTISHESQDSFRKLYNCNSLLIYNGVPRPVIDDKCGNIVQQYRLTSSTRVFLHPGRICDAKNQVVLCRVFERLIDEGYDVVLLMAGSNQDDAIMQSLQPYFRNERIKYLGEVENVPQLLAHSDGMCLPSIYEGMPCTLLEAFAVGCIPVCTPVGGIKDTVVDGSSGFLAASPAFEDYLHAMKRMLAAPHDEIKRMRLQCKASFEKFDIDIVAENYIKHYQAACNSR